MIISRIDCWKHIAHPKLQIFEFSNLYHMKHALAVNSLQVVIGYC